MATAIMKAEIDRTALVHKIVMIEKKIANHDVVPLTITAAETQIENARKLKISLDEIQYRICHIAPPNMVPHEQEYESFADRIDESIAFLKEVIRVQTPAPPPPVTGSSSPRRISMRLPEMQLPLFEGRFEDWPSFEDLFKATIDTNPALSSAQKLQYLKSCVRGPAADMIKSFIITDHNYQEAWSLLSTRYNNKREIVYSLVKKILFQQQIKTESASALQVLLNSTMECVRSLRVMGQPTDKWDSLLVVTLVEKLDSDTRSEWAKGLTGTNPTTFAELVKFLESHIRSLIAKGVVTTRVTTTTTNTRQARTHFVSSSSSLPSCTVCKGPHQSFQCSKLLEMDPSQRVAAVRKSGACLNCLRDGHIIRDCSSNKSCRHCGAKHHTLLHFPRTKQGNNSSQSSSNNSGPNPPAGNGSSNPAATVRGHNASIYPSEKMQVLLKTAIVELEDSFGNKHPCRALLDDGSEASFITESLASTLGLSRSRTSVRIQGISAAEAAHAKWKVTTQLFSTVHDARVEVEALILKQVTGTLPRVPCDTTQWNHLNGLKLADPAYHTPGDIDILLGADVVPFIMREGRRTGVKYSPVAQNSIFGWVLSGKVSVIEDRVITSNHGQCRLEELVQRFWEIEEVPARTPLSEEEAACVAHFKATHTRNTEGRYKVRLPFNSKASSIGDTRDLAVRRLLQLEKRFKKYPQQHEAYKRFMKEYLDLGHMELVTNSSTAVNKPVYIPHHFVVKEDSSTTKLRVVFDASMKSSTGVSLNDALMVGPTIQEDLFTLLLRFRSDEIALKGDVEKMYRQFEVHEDDRDYQRILWRESEDQPMQEYRLTTVTYGTACAPSLATFSLDQLAEDEEKRFPLAAKAVKERMYVDDLLGGAKNKERSLELYTQLIQLCEAGCLKIRKWCSNSTEVLRDIPHEMQELQTPMDFDTDATVKALGIRWQPSGDYFYFHAEKPTQQHSLTKREILSQIAKTFDPIGWIAPVTVTAKILFQELWRESMDWDSPVSEEIHIRWENYQQQLQYVSSIHIPRCVIPNTTIQFQIHGFADASEKAYASAVYLRCTLSTGEVLTSLLTSRTKVAPLKQTSLPRLELCGALLLAETIEAVLKCYKFQHTIHGWTDSMIALKWMTAPSRRWKTFVANRVAAIQDIIPPRCWSHVVSEDNPADLPSRGVPVQDLVENSMWWSGPSWLSTNTFPSSQSTFDLEEVVKEEKTKKITTHLGVENCDTTYDALMKLSTLQKIVSTAGWFVRFVTFMKNKHKCSRGPLTPDERNFALLQVIKLAQQSSFGKEIAHLNNNTTVSMKSKLSSLAPWIDCDGLLRVGGRIQKSAATHYSKHPLIIPNNSPISTLIVRDCHLRQYHSGFNHTLATIRRKYWILKTRDVVRNVVRQCVTCKKVKAAQSQQLMGNLPIARVSANRPFLHCGVDFAGPFYVKMRRGRGAKSEKCYMAVFVCFSTKAVHLEVVTDMSSDAFVACYRRFVSRRGVSKQIYSDCGTNFVGADRLLKKMFQECEVQIQQQLSLSGTSWVFNPPAAPHQGGLWEAAVKSAKHHIKRVIGSSLLTLEQFQTLLCNVEACLNSRPLCSLSSDPAEYDVLTPGHFLIGEPLNAVPEPDLTMEKSSRLDHWKQVQQMTHNIWKRWKEEYLVTLQERTKWKKKYANMRVGDLVIVREDVLPPSKWRMGRVVDIALGGDGLVRSATVKTANGLLTRPIQKLSIILEYDEN